LEEQLPSPAANRVDRIVQLAFEVRGEVPQLIDAVVDGEAGAHGRGLEPADSARLGRRRSFGLAHTFNRLFDRIEALLLANKHVSADIAHDLRKPLSHVLGRLEEARSGDGGPAAVAEAIDEAGFSNPKHRQQWRNTLTTYCQPIWATPIDVVDTKGCMGFSFHAFAAPASQRANLDSGGYERPGGLPKLSPYTDEVLSTAELDPRRGWSAPLRQMARPCQEIVDDE
jgi:hypothetical protein